VSIGVRSRPVADASGAPVLRDQGPIGRPGTARPMQASTIDPCFQSQIGRFCHMRRQETAQVEAALALSVVVWSGPFMTAANGTLARPAGKAA
jgi:hypothetical protein